MCAQIDRTCEHRIEVTQWGEPSRHNGCEALTTCNTWNRKENFHDILESGKRRDQMCTFGRSVGRPVGQSVGRSSMGRSVGRSISRSSVGRRSIVRRRNSFGQGVRVDSHDPLPKRVSAADDRFLSGRCLFSSNLLWGRSWGCWMGQAQSKPRQTQSKLRQTQGKPKANRSKPKANPRQTEGKPRQTQGKSNAKPTRHTTSYNRHRQANMHLGTPAMLSAEVEILYSRLTP
jgi:hypothetical protein